MPSPTVLALDAGPDSRDALALALKDAGFATVMAGAPGEGLALLTSLRPHAVVLDLDGVDEPIDLLRQLHAEAPDIPLVALCRSGEPALVVRAMRAGSSDFVVKPVAAGALGQAVRAALGAAEPSPAAAGLEPDRGAPDLDLLFHGSARMRTVERIVRQAADTTATILLQGESGTGKEMVAKAIHAISGRRDKPFLKVNCASLPGDLLESELFGHEKGAFTGAHRRKPGKFELAHRGTFLLDEIGEIPLPLQAKLLHVLQDGTFFRVGGSELIDTDVRLLAATNRDLASVVAAGLFREDLYYRLNVVTITVPPLRERREEIPRLVEHFLRKFCRQYDREAPAVSPDTLRLLHDYAWPGNVRELENMIKRLVVLQNETLIEEEIALRRNRPWPGPPGGTDPATIAHRSPQIPAPAPPVPALPPLDLGLKEIAKRAAMEAEKAVLKEVLDRVRWNRAEAARLLKISYKALLYKIAAAGLDAKTERRMPGK